MEYCNMSKRLHKEGFVREDGKVYWRYQKEKGHIWITPEQYAAYVATRRRYRRACLEEYYRQREKQNPIDRSYYGKYCFRRNRYFIGLTASGKENWVIKEKYLNHREKQNKNRKKFSEKLRMQEKPNLKIGDQHPDNPELFVCFFIGNKPYFGSKTRLLETQERRKIACRKRDIKYKKIRTDKLSKLENKHRRGDVHPENGAVFWEYNIRCKEIWLAPEVFTEKREKDLQKRKNLRLKKKGLPNV